MTKKKVLIFGAGINQVTLIKACNQLGYQSIVIDPNENAPGRYYADVFKVVAPDDYENTKETARIFQVDGIATSQMENPLRLMSKLAEELGFIFNKPEIIERGLNKHLMKKAFTDNGVLCAKYKLFSDKTAITEEALKEFEFPLIVKPVDAHSSRGVYKVDRFSEIFNYIEETFSFSKTGNVLIEEFIEGPEFSVEAVTFNGETTIVQHTEKIITPFPNVVEIGHIQPAINLTEYQKNKVDQEVIKAIKAIGLDNTVTHTEVKYSEKGPFIIEVGPRMGGDFISSYLVLHSCGVNLDKATVQLALGFKPDLSFVCDQFSFIQYLQLKPGNRIKRIGNWKKILKMPGVVFAHVQIQEGEIIPKITDSARRPGFVIVEGKSRTEVVNLSNKYLKILKNSFEYY